MADTFKGTDGALRPLEEHRTHLQAELDQAVDPSSPRFDEGFASKLRAELAALPSAAKPPSPPAPTGSTPERPGFALVMIDEQAVADIEAFRQGGPDSALAMNKKKIKLDSLMRRVLRAVLTARVERR
jgi:hypothetical protein